MCDAHEVFVYLYMRHIPLDQIKVYTAVPAYLCGRGVRRLAHSAGSEVEATIVDGRSPVSWRTSAAGSPCPRALACWAARGLPVLGASGATCIMPPG